MTISPFGASSPFNERPLPIPAHPQTVQNQEHALARLEQFYDIVPAQSDQAGSDAEPQQPKDQPDTYDNLTFREKFQLLRRAGSEDFRSSGILQKVGMAVTAGWLAYEWGPGNETVTPIIAGAVINNVDGPKGMLAAAGIAGGFTFAQQVLSGATVAGTASQFPNLAKTAFETMQDNEHPELNAKPWKELEPSKKLLYSFTMGTTFIASREAAVTGKTKFTENIPRVIASAAMTGTVVAGLAAGIEAVDYYSAAAPSAVETAGDIGVAVITSPFFWLGILGLSAYNTRKERNAMRQSLAAQKATAETE